MNKYLILASTTCLVTGVLILANYKKLSIKVLNFIDIEAEK